VASAADRRSTEPERRPDVAVIGGGVSGIGAAIEIERQGLGTPLILERAAELGGTWRDNTYPGCACDIPSHLYSYSFAPNPDWSRFFAPQGEIQRDVLDVVERHGVRARASVGTEVHAARWDDATQAWHLDTSTGPVRAPALVLAAGPLHEPVLPDVPGRDRFTGDAFHSARWRHDLDLRGRRVAVVGTGASAAQFVPQIQPDVESLVLFQRTPAWVMPKPDRRITAPERWLLRRVPGLQRLVRGGIWAGLDLMIVSMRWPGLIRRVVHPIARRHIRRGVADPELQAALTPDYVLGCKRVLISNDYYPALGRPNVTVVPRAVAEVRERSIVDTAGVEHEVDTIIYATGFHVNDLPVADRVFGRDGRSLAEVWAGQPRAYRGTSISGFPNAFMLFGPNVGTANAFSMLDAQLRYLVGGLRALRDSKLASADVRPAAQAAWNQRLHRQLDGTVWLAGGCTSYYLDSTGQNASAWPRTMRALQRALRRFPIEDFDTVPSSPAAVARPGARAGAR
jgi:cation diffusion facilitator CzcD-associated flavoprotein CzcO